MPRQSPIFGSKFLSDTYGGKVNRLNCSTQSKLFKFYVPTMYIKCDRDSLESASLQRVKSKDKQPNTLVTHYRFTRTIQHWEPGKFMKQFVNS